ncbi:acyl-CoA dehydrogenase family protein [Streptomyces sp. NPDC089919]|uniref:acyl-CoA dehydrogenase family protein n=1 Tax=Streptomyces sp. NPDC089919 TaxID=3155188 RepID=UPI0034344303
MTLALPVRAAETEHRALLRTARDVAEDLAADAIARDRTGAPPLDEAARLREAGLLAALTPPGPDRGTDWRTGCAVIREISAADSSVGEVLARHYANAWSGRFFADGPRADELEEESLRGQWLWTGALRGPAPEDGTGPADLTLRRRGTGYLISGRRAVATAVTVADQILVDALCPATGDVLVLRIAPGARGVSLEPAPDRLGQRVAGAGELVLDRVTVPARLILGRRPQDEEPAAPGTALAGPALRLALCHVGLGIVEGALTEARDLSRGGHGHRSPGGDPDLLLTYGELATAAQTATAVVHRATDVLAAALGAGPHLGTGRHADTGPHLDHGARPGTGAHLGTDDPATVAALVATAENVTSKAALDITTRVLELADAPGLDRFWRNARVLTAHHPATTRLRSIGEHYLNASHRVVAAAFH